MNKQMKKDYGLTEIKFSNRKDAYLTSNMNHAKFQLNRLLSNLPKGSVAYVAGGAPRDWHHGFGHRDIDIFYHVKGEPLSVYKPHLGKSVECHLDIEGITSSDKYYVTDEDTQYWSNTYNDTYINIPGLGDYELGPICTRYIKRVNTYNVRRKARPVQLIEVDRNPLDVIADFPINMSKIFMHKTGRVYAFDDYLHGYDFKIIAELHRKQYNYSYINKILGRYHDYAFVPLNHRERPRVA